MADEGFIKIHRKILKWEWYDDVNVVKLFLHCLILANHKTKHWHGIPVVRGQFITSVGKLAKQTGLSVKQIRLALKKLKTTNEVTSEPTNRFTMITVNEYSTYHVNEKEEGKQKGNQTANEGQTEGKQRATTKNVKNDKNDKKIKKKNIGEVDLIIPECITEKIFNDYVENRIEIKKPMTHRAKELFLMKVERLHGKGEDVKALIETSIMRNYTDIYEQKGKGYEQNTGTSKRKPVEKARTKSDYIKGRDTVVTIEGKRL